MGPSSCRRQGFIERDQEMVVAEEKNKERQKSVAVPLLDLRAQYEPLRDEMLAAIERVMDSQQFIMGPEVKALEDETAAYCDAAHAIGCASGSDALLLALMALDVKAGDEVITTPYSFFATAGSIARLGARPVFVDIERDTFNIDPKLIEAAITPKTRAILPVHLFGQCAEMDEINRIAAKHELPVIEDAAQAIGAEYKGRRAGSMSAVGCFSYYPSKNLGGVGDGGMMTANDDALARKLRMLRVHGGETKYRHILVGINSRLDSVQAAVLRVKLPHLDEWTAKRQRNAQIYSELFSAAGLTDKITLPLVRDGVRHIFNQFVIRVGEVRDALVEHLKEQKIGTDIYYPIPLHLQECFGYLGYKAGDLLEAERAALETIALPIYPELSREQQESVVNAIGRFFA
jgi:dTDP-4-amino-4,6-dideoxygalactose transaminase